MTAPSNEPRISVPAGLAAAIRRNFGRQIDFCRSATALARRVAPTLEGFRSLLEEAFGRTGKPVRLIGVGVRFAEPTPENAQMDLL